MAHLNVYPWQLSTGLESGWVGGPGQDADGERTGGRQGGVSKGKFVLANWLKCQAWE